MFGDKKKFSEFFFCLLENVAKGELRLYRWNLIHRNTAPNGVFYCSPENFFNCRSLGCIQLKHCIHTSVHLRIQRLCQNIFSKLSTRNAPPPFSCLLRVFCSDWSVNSLHDSVSEIKNTPAVTKRCFQNTQFIPERRRGSRIAAFMKGWIHTPLSHISSHSLERILIQIEIQLPFKKKKVNHPPKKEIKSLPWEKRPLSQALQETAETPNVRRIRVWLALQTRRRRRVHVRLKILAPLKEMNESHPQPGDTPGTCTSVSQLQTLLVRVCVMQTISPIQDPQASTARWHQGRRWRVSHLIIVCVFLFMSSSEIGGNWRTQWIIILN